IIRDPDGHTQAVAVAAVNDLKPGGSPGLREEAFPLPGCVGTPCQLDWRIWGGSTPTPGAKCRLFSGWSFRCQPTEGWPPLWSPRRPGNYSLTGHTSPVESVRLNTPEELIVAGSQSGSIRVWDLEAAKILRTLMGHKANICSLDFHPYGEFVASGSQDTNIKVRRCLCPLSPGHSQAVRCLRWLASAADDHTVKLWDLTAGKMMSEFPGHTGPVNVVEFHPNEYLLASGGSDRTIRFWDLEKFQVVSCIEGEPGPVRYAGSWVAALDPPPGRLDVGMGYGRDSRPLAQQPAHPSAPLRRIYERPSTACSKPQRVKQNSEGERRSPSSEDDRDERESRAEIQNAEEYNEIFQPKNSISRTPPRRSEPFPAPPEDDMVSAKEAAKPSPAMDLQFPVPNLEVPPRPPAVTSTPEPKAEPAIIPATRNEPIGLKASDFLPAVKIPQQVELVDEDAMSQIRKGHDTMCVVLTSRHKNLDTVRAVWTTGDIKTSVDSAVAINDLSVVVDLLNIVNQKASLWKLDLCTTVLPQIEKLLQSKYESYVQTGCTSLKLILQRFLPLITDILAAPPSVGVDISREERLHKCRLCYKQLKSISGLVKSKSGLSGRHGSAFRELHLLMASLD
uniref:Katanin regulatory subunit B1 n=1 Tax=Ursus maritimus TaxID=29073 RepID=A0A452V8H3_URSMA